MIYIFDIDGTLADISHRLHFIQQKPADWTGFFRACPADKPIKEVVEIYKVLQNEHSIKIITGRSSEILDTLTPAEFRRYSHCELFQIGLDELRRQHTNTPLSPQQMRIASMLAEGFSRTEIGAELGIDQHTIKMHLNGAYKRLGLDDHTFNPRIRLGVYWNCELFQIGLEALAA